MPKKTKYGTLGNFQGNASEHPLYFRWMNMLRRCYEPSFYGYNSYGGKGVSVEPFLQVFSNYVDFVSSLPNYESMLKNPDGWQIDKDEKGGYEYSRKTIQIIPSHHNLDIENAKKRIPVYSISPDGIRREYCSITSSEMYTGVHKGNIARAARMGYKAGGYEWGYIND